MTCSPEAKRKPNKGMELTASSVRSCLAPASGSSSCLAVSHMDRGQHFCDAFCVYRLALTFLIIYGRCRTTLGSLPM